MIFLLLSFLCLGVGQAVIEAPILQAGVDQNPSSLEWRHIVTEHFDVIFPREIEAQAQRAAHLLEKAYPYVTRSLDVKPPRIPLVLENQTVVSNGLVSLAPRRSEWNVTPAIDPELSNTEWLKTLAVHEFRHVAQIQKARQGFNRYYYYLFGEVGQVLGLGFTLPMWYLEGDAVGIETALTSGGRGRLPLFERDLRTLLLSGRKFDYDKAHLGSYRDYVPNHYVYGYFYTSFLRQKHGDLFLSELADESARRSYNPLTFYNAYKRQTGDEFEEFYRNTLAELVGVWKQKLDELKPTPYAVKSLGPRHGWTNYYYPQATGGGQTLALKRGLSHIDQFVLLDGKKEKTLFYPGPLAQEYPYKVRGDKLAFLELELDPRWGMRDFTRLKVFDLRKKKFTVDVPRKKWRLAVLDQKGEDILLVEWTDRQEQSLLVLDATGKEKNRIPYPSSEVITSVDWVNAQEIVLVTKDQNDQKSLAKLNLATSETTPLIEKTPTNLGFVTVAEQLVLFESPASGIDNIWLHTPEGPRQLTSSRFGAYAPAIKDGKLLYNDYSVKGMNVVEKATDLLEEQKSENSFYPVYEKLLASEKVENLSKDLETPTTYAVKPYSQTRNAVNPHSWVLLAPPLSSIVTVAAVSRDILNNLTLTAGGLYDLNERTSQGFVSGTWSHYYPVFDLRAAFGTRRQRFSLGGSTVEDRWDEGTLEAGVGLPWRKITGRFVHTFTVRAFSKLIRVNHKAVFDPSELSGGTLFSPGAEFSYDVSSRLSRRDILPPWGFSVSGHAQEGKDITGTGQRGRLVSGDSRLYLPGPWLHHSFWHQFAYERQIDESYQYSSLVFYPRGTRNVFLEELRKYSGNYTLPIFYPDWHWSRYVYVKRITLNLF